MNTYDVTGTTPTGEIVKIIVYGTPDCYVAKQIAGRDREFVSLTAKKSPRADARKTILERNAAQGYDTVVIKGF